GAVGPPSPPPPTPRPAPPSSAAPAPGAPSAPAPPSAKTPDTISGEADIEWLVEHSMLHQGDLATRRYSGQRGQWQHPYAVPQPRAASALASVWFTAYPPSQITGPGEPVLQSLDDPELWGVFRDVGIRRTHAGPMI